MGVEQIREVLEIYLITGGISSLVLKCKKEPPSALSLSTFRRRKWVHFYQNITQVLFCFLKDHWSLLKRTTHSSSTKLPS